MDWWMGGGVAGGGVNCASGGGGLHASKNKPDRLPLHIHVSQRRFIAPWHNVRTINVSYMATLSHYRDSLTCGAFKYRMCTALTNKTFRV